MTFMKDASIYTTFIPQIKQISSENHAQVSARNRFYYAFCSLIKNFEENSPASPLPPYGIKPVVQMRDEWRPVVSEPRALQGL